VFILFSYGLEDIGAGVPSSIVAGKRRRDGYRWNESRLARDVTVARIGACDVSAGHIGWAGAQFFQNAVRKRAIPHTEGTARDVLECR
jgi:hypothetical protein